MSTFVWQQRGAIMVPVPYQPPPVVEPPRTRLLACPVCGARVDQSCRSVNGVRRRPHPVRVVSRRCPCGALLDPHRKLCEPCRVAARVAKDRARRRRVAS